MKLIYAIVRDEDGHRTMSELAKNRFQVTKLASTGGFLRSGNTTLVIGTEAADVDKVIDIIRAACSKRKQIVATPMPADADGKHMPPPVTVDIGGAVVFVINVDRFEKI